MADRVRQAGPRADFPEDRQFSRIIVSLFEPHSETIPGKESKPTEFGKLVQVQEAENQIIANYRVFAERPSDQELLGQPWRNISGALGGGGHRILFSGE